VTRWESKDLHCVFLKKVVPESEMKSASFFEKLFWLGSIPDRDPKNLEKNIREPGAAIFFRDW
jgi:hypothetical protein